MPSWGHLSANENLKNKNMNRAATKKGNEGEKATMRLLDAQFAADPTMCILHDLNIPTADGRGTEPANVDHVIITGNKVLLIDSKSWKPGKFKTRRNGITYRDRQPFPAADTHTLDMVAHRYTNFLAQHGISADRMPHWIGLTVVWPTNPSRMSLRRIKHKSNNTNDPLTVLFCKGEQIKKLVTVLSCREPEPDDEIVNTFLKLLRKPAPR
jgi:hypothetical protein